MLFVGCFCAFSAGAAVYGADTHAQDIVEAAPLFEGNADVVEMIVATVDGEPLTLGDLRRFIRSKGETVPEPLNANNPEAQRYLRDMIMDQLIAKEAKEAGVTISEEEVDVYISEIKKQNNVDDSTFIRLLGERGLALEEYKVQVRADILRARLVAQKVRAKINVPDEDIARYLQEHPELAPKQGTVHVQQVLVKNGNDSAKTRTLTEAIREKVSAGASWTEAGREYYRDLGYVSPGDLREDMQQALQVLELGAISGTICSPRDCFFLQIISKNAEGQEVDAKLKEQIRGRIFESRFIERVEKYLKEELPKKYNVELKL